MIAKSTIAVPGGLDRDLEGIERLAAAGIHEDTDVIDDRLDVREDVLASMLRFPRQGPDLFLSSLLVGNIPRNRRCADNLAVGIFDRRNGQ